MPEGPGGLDERGDLIPFEYCINCGAPCRWPHERELGFCFRCEEELDNASRTSD